jgi:hypothetical protein
MSRRWHHWSEVTPLHHSARFASQWSFTTLTMMARSIADSLLWWSITILIIAFYYIFMIRSSSSVTNLILLPCCLVEESHLVYVHVTLSCYYVYLWPYPVSSSTGVLILLSPWVICNVLEESASFQSTTYSAWSLCLIWLKHLPRLFIIIMSVLLHLLYICFLLHCSSTCCFLHLRCYSMHYILISSNFHKLKIFQYLKKIQLARICQQIFFGTLQFGWLFYFSNRGRTFNNRVAVRVRHGPGPISLMVCLGVK